MGVHVEQGIVTQREGGREREGGKRGGKGGGGVNRFLCLCGGGIFTISAWLEKALFRGDLWIDLKPQDDNLLEENDSSPRLFFTFETRKKGLIWHHIIERYQGEM